MKKQIVSRKGSKTSLGLPEKESNVEKAKRQNVLSGDLFSRLTLKHYPSIFQDERLTTRLFV